MAGILGRKWGKKKKELKWQPIAKRDNWVLLNDTPEEDNTNEIIIEIDPSESTNREDIDYCKNEWIMFIND